LPLRAGDIVGECAITCICAWRVVPGVPRALCEAERARLRGVLLAAEVALLAARLRPLFFTLLLLLPTGEREQGTLLPSEPPFSLPLCLTSVLLPSLSPAKP